MQGLIHDIKNSKLFYFMDRPDAVNGNVKRRFYTQLTFVFHLQEDFYIVHNQIDAFCFFLFQKCFYIVRDHTFVLCFYLLQKDFDTFNKPYFETFLCFVDNIKLASFIYRKKNVKKCFIVFLYAVKC